MSQYNKSFYAWSSCLTETCQYTTQPGGYGDDLTIPKPVPAYNAWSGVVTALIFAGELLCGALTDGACIGFGAEAIPAEAGLGLTDAAAGAAGDAAAGATGDAAAGSTGDGAAGAAAGNGEPGAAGGGDGATGAAGDTANSANSPSTEKKVPDEPRFEMNFLDMLGWAHDFYDWADYYREQQSG
jgi:hypothetical protein